MSTTVTDDIEQREALLDAWVQAQQRLAQVQAEASALLAERMRLCEADIEEFPFQRESILRSMFAEYSAAGHVAKGTVENAFFDAMLLHQDHPIALESYGRGAITAAHVHEIIAAAEVVQAAVREGRADAVVLEIYETAAVAAAESDTPMRTRAAVRRIAAALAGETVVERHARAATERSVTVRSVEDGLALLQIVLPEYLAMAIHDRLTQLARQVIATRDEREPFPDPADLDSGADAVFPEDIAQDDPARDDSVIFGEDGTFALDPEHDVEHIPFDERTIDQVRADLVIDLLLAADPSEVNGSGLDNIHGRVQVTIAATTLAGEDDRPAELDGCGPMHPDLARSLAGRTGLWSRLFLDPTGMVVETDAYSPTENMKRLLRARDQHCRFPGCRMPVHRCQLDHNHDHAIGGRTRIDNLSAFCAGHHALKHPDVDARFRWTARQAPDGSVAWTSPLGRTYLDPPPRRVMFV